MKSNFQIDEICRPLMLNDEDLKRVMSALLKEMEKGLNQKTGLYCILSSNFYA